MKWIRVSRPVEREQLVRQLETVIASEPEWVSRDVYVISYYLVTTFA